MEDSQSPANADDDLSEVAGGAGGGLRGSARAGTCSGGDDDDGVDHDGDRDRDLEDDHDHNRGLEDDHDHDHDHDHDGHDGHEADTTTARRGSRLLPAVVLAGGAGIVALVMRCGPATPPEDGLAVPPGAEDIDAAPDSTKPEPARADEPKPEPADDRPEQSEPDQDAEPEAAEPDPPPQDWAKDITAPELVTYTVRRGGAIKNVANLYKIFHHEITALNPGIGLDDELPPGTAVVVYRRQPGEVSESVGVASNGSLEGGVPMLDGPGRVLKMIPWKSWATGSTVATLDRVLRQWAADESNEQPILVGNMSARDGGRLEPHSTHQSGRDVDLGYPQILPKGEELNWREMNADNLDPAATWRLLRLVRATGRLEAVFIDSKIQKLLYEWARKEGGMSKATLRRWMEYPRTPPVSSALIQHVPGHVDHLHVRFKCGAAEKRCKSRKR